MVAQTLLHTHPHLGTLAQAADILACDPKTVRRYVADGRLTGYRIGPRNLRVDLNEVSSLIRPVA